MLNSQSLLIICLECNKIFLSLVPLTTVNEFIGEDIQSYQSRSQMDNLPN